MNNFRLDRFAAVLCLAAVGFVGWSASVVAQTLTQFPVPTALSGPNDITAGPDGALWFTESAGNKIGRITITGAVTEFPIPTANSEPYGITAGPDGALWFVEYQGHKIGRITTTGTITEYPTPTANSGPSHIAAGSDGALWFTESTSNKIGRITTTGVITEFPVPTAHSTPNDITAGPDGALWFTESHGNKIGRITTAGAITEFPIPTTNGFPHGITAGPDGALWFAELQGNKIGRITTAGAITEFPLPRAVSGPWGIAAGPDGAVWYTDYVGEYVGRITTTGTITEFPLPTHSLPHGITAGPDGALWVGLYGANINAIGRLTTPAGTSSLVAATLPASRSVQVGSPATAFATIINTGTMAGGCGIMPISSAPASFQFQTTDPATNALTGSPNTRVNIAAGAAQSFLVAFTATGPLVPTDVVLGFGCADANAVAPIVGVNTLLLTFAATPVPDIIAVGLTPSNDGYSRTGGPAGTGIFVIASTNIGTGASLTARARLSDPALSAITLVCQTNPGTGQCLSMPTPTVTATVNQNENTTWTAFIQASGTIVQDPARNRVFFEFLDPDGVVRGSTSTALTTQ